MTTIIIIIKVVLAGVCGLLAFLSYASYLHTDDESESQHAFTRFITFLCTLILLTAIIIK